MKRVCPKCNIEKLLETKNFYKDKNNSEGFQYTCKDCHKSHYKRKAWKLTEESRIRDNNYRKKRYKEDPIYRLKVQLINRVNQYLKKGNNDSTIDFLGCSVSEYKEYLENQFTENMTWSNQGSYWEIDHTIPLSKGGSFHYTNTTPMTVTENRKKGNNV
jgi:5-methylcytosine-specific restriction endonuclease McrA